MIFIRHRINTVNDLKTVSPGMGVELDLRYEGDRIILQHDPYKSGELFEDYLAHYSHDVMILNVKSEGIEAKVLDLVRRAGVKKYFFLDCSFPMIIKLSNQGITDIAVRFSEHEPLEQCLALQGRVRWVWVDCFTRCPLDTKAYEQLKKHFKICIVSPELQQHPLERIAEFKKQFQGFEIDAICTKKPELWQA